MRFQVAFNQSNQRVNANFNSSQQKFGASFACLQKITEYNDVDPYTGSYEVTPKVDAQTLQTAQKMMTDDLIVTAIPIYEVSNNSGGHTVYIAREV